MARVGSCFVPVQKLVDDIKKVQAELHKLCDDVLAGKLECIMEGFEPMCNPALLIPYVKTILDESVDKKLQQLKVEKKLDLDEIAVACLEIEQEMAKQESRPKNRRKQEAKLKNGLEKKLARENKNTSKVNRKEVEEEELQGEGVQQLSEINMTGESSAEATRLTELIRISVEVRLKIFALQLTQSDSTESLDIAGRCAIGS